ncbi:hypothetical protein [Streptomyces sp. RTd22]|uniref:hypothetical protein n=1 Tax=Streptomyces sp. RTd22 TaxID=1841249 RepID=UPI0007C439E7|nr:hypothetical protein [Streptomyces sp. RTd22]
MRFCSTPEVALTDQEITRLADLPHAAHEVTPGLDCELELGHEGPHYALAQADDRSHDSVTNWWLRWDEANGPREWVHDPACRVDSPTGDELCLLPEGHAGGHSWT